MKRGSSIKNESAVEVKKKKTFTPQKDVKPKFEKKTLSKKRVSDHNNKTNIKEEPDKTYSKVSIKEEPGVGDKNIKASLKKEKASLKKEGIISPKPKEASPKKKYSKQQKVKSAINENLAKKKLFKKNNLGKKSKKNKDEFPLDKDGKPQWTKVKLEKKKLKETRKVHRTGENQYNLSVKAKSIWEKLRREHTEEVKEALVNELFMLLKGQIPNVVHCHDMARVVQWMLKLGSPSIRSSICEALSSNTVEYLQSKYARFCVKRALKYGSKADRNSLMKSCNGHFLKLFSHTFASPVVELMYAVYASPEQCRQIHKEMLGDMYTLFNEEQHCIEHLPAVLKRSVLAATKNNLTKLLTKKHLLKYTLLQSLLLDFFTSCSEEDRIEVMELIQGDVLELLNTKQGSRLALQVVWHGTNKVKKVIVKSLKGKVKQIAFSEMGHILLLALFDCVDDTVLVKKAIIPEVISQALEFAENEWGRKVILYLVARRDPAYFHPHQIIILAKGDAIATSKKDCKVRELEILEAVSGPLLEQIAADPSAWLKNSSVAMVSLAIMKSGIGEKARKEAFNKLIDFILDPEYKIGGNDRNLQVIESKSVHLVLKKLLQQHSQQTEENDNQETFAKVLESRLTEKELNYMIEFNRGCFILVLLLELKSKAITSSLKKKITEPIKKLIQKQGTSGSKILLKKLSEID